MRGTMKNTHEDHKAGNMHKWSHNDAKLNPRLVTNIIKGNTIDECNDFSPLNSDFEINDVQRKFNQMNYLSNLSLEDDKIKYFIKNLDQDMARNTLLGCYKIINSVIGCNNLSEGDVEL